MDHETCVPPGFRFHPTEEELVGYYLNRKINSLKFELDVIVDIDLYRIEPWDIQDKCKLGYAEQNEWYFFSHKDRKYPTGTRTNRATGAGFWKATGRDKAVLSKNNIIGMRKTLVFYKGRAPNGRKTDWIMHEYRLQSTEHAPPQEEGWVVCRAFKKPSPSHRQGYEAWNHQYNYYMRNNNNNINHNNIMGSPSIPHLDSTELTDSITQGGNNNNTTSFHNLQQVEQPFGNFEQEYSSSNVSLLDLPGLDSPSLSTSFVNKENYHQRHSCVRITNEDHDHKRSISSSKWQILDSLLGSHQLPVTTTTSFSNLPNLQLVPSHDFELESQNQLNSFLGCFPNL